MPPRPRRIPLCLACWAALALAGCFGLSVLDEPPDKLPAALPAGAQPLPPELQARMTELVKTTEKLRGLRLLRPVPWGMLGEEALRRNLMSDLHSDMTPGELQSVQVALQTFGLIPADLDLATYLPALLTAEVAGYYDPRRQSLVLVRRPAPDGSAGETAPHDEPNDESNDELDDELDDMVLVHELTHALQDQHYGLAAFTDVDPLSDEGTARSALVEGDAMRTTLRFVAGSQEAFDQMAKLLMADPQQLASLANQPGGLADAPPYLRDTLLFGYIQGLAFCLRLEELGGQPLLDRAFTSDPPRSSEQILHPGKWASKKDAPVAVVLPDVARLLPGHIKAAEGELGELGIRILLRGAATDMASRKAAETAAAGWGGDRFAVYTRGERRVLVWITEWDGETDAAEFQAAAARLGSGWDVRRPSPRRVQLVRVPHDENGEAAARALGRTLTAPPAAPSPERRPSPGRSGHG